MNLQTVWESKILRGVAAFFLWISSAILSFLLVTSLQTLIFKFYVYCCADNRWGFSVVKQWSTILMMIIWIGFTITSGDYHGKHFNETKSWKLFGISYLVIVLLFIPTLIF